MSSNDMKDKINKICTELNDGKIAVVQATEQLFDLYSVADLPTSTQLLSDCKKRFKELEGKGNLDYRSYRNGYLDSFSKNVVSKIK